MLSFFLAILESDADRQMFVTIYEQHHSQMERVAIKILKNQPMNLLPRRLNTFICVLFVRMIDKIWTKIYNVLRHKKTHTIIN